MSELNLPQSPLVTELEFPETVPETNLDESTTATLARQALVCEFAANGAFARYAGNELSEHLWIAKLAPELARFGKGLIPQEFATTAETRTTMAATFNQRIEAGRVVTADFNSIFDGLVALLQPDLIAKVNPILEEISKATSPTDSNAYLNAGNNAAAFTIEDPLQTGANGVLKWGHSIIHEFSNCDQSAHTNLRRWLGLSAGRGVEGFEQPIAFSAEAPISITEYVPGMELEDIAVMTSKPQPSEESLIAFANAVYESMVRGIQLDIHGRDLLFEPDTDTLTIIDHNKLNLPRFIQENYYSHLARQTTDVFKNAFGYEFDEIGFRRLLSEYIRQGLFDLKKRDKEAMIYTQ